MTDFYKKNDNLLRDKLTQHEFAPSSNAWENMSALLDQHPVVPKRAIGYWWSVPFVTAAALAGVIGLGMHFLPNATTTSNDSFAEQTAKESTVPRASKQFPELTSPAFAVKPTLAEEKQTKVVTRQAKVERKTTSKQALPTTVSSSKKTTAIKGSTTNVPTLNSQAKELKNASPVKSEAKGVETKGVETKEIKRKVKTTRTEIIYQYSTTPLRALQEKRKLMEKQNTIGNFGIGDELNTKKSPLKASVFGGASAKVYGSTKDFSVMPFAGASVSYRIAKHHGIQTGVQYKSIGNLTQNSKGQMDSGMNPNSELSIKRIDLLEIPLVYQFHPHPKYNIQAGVKGAWLMNTETSDPAFNNLSNAEMGISDFDFSLLLGMEYCLNEHWAIGIQYSLGLINLTKKASSLHEEEVQTTRDAGYDPQYNISSLNKYGELIVPIHSENTQNQSVKVPNQLHNNDVQLLLKYTF